MHRTPQVFVDRHTPSLTRSARYLWGTGVIASAFLFAGCGLLDVYKPHEKRCKAFCENEKDATASDTPFNFDLGYWNQTTPRSQLDPNTELVPLLRSNPFKLLGNSLKTVSDDLTEAQQSLNKTPPTAQTECLKEVFGAAVKISDERSETSLDYGRCVDLAKLEERLNGSRNVARDGKLKVIELDSALQLVNLGTLPTQSGTDALHEAQSGFDLLSIIPFRSLRTADLKDPDRMHTFKIHLVRGSVQGTALEKASSPTILKKSWGLLYAGLDERQPLQISWTPKQNTIQLTGSVATLSASFQRPTTQTQWDGFGYSREFIFTDFSLSGTNLEINSQLGWNEQAILSGSYFLRINGDLVDAGGEQSKLFHMKGLRRPCTLDVGLVTGFQDGIPQEEALGQISICSASN